MTGPTDLPKGAKVGTSTKLYYGSGQAVESLQLVVVGEVSGVGGEIAWQFRRSS